MKKKYYFRGLGVGILVTAILFSIGLIFYKPSLSDEEIREKALAMGMIDRSGSSESAADASDSKSGKDAATSESGADASDSESGADASAPAAKKSGDGKADGSTTTTNPDGSTTTTTNLSPEEVVTENSNAGSNSNAGANANASSNSNAGANSNTGAATASPSGDFGTITISAGQDSRIVSKNLYKAGIIDDSTDFNDYLESNHFDKYIMNGSYNIKKGASYEEIMHTITSK